ncbi:hypothetical protein V8C42DRAFT_316605 [Trichoderma barbatum]
MGWLVLVLWMPGLRPCVGRDEKRKTAWRAMSLTGWVLRESAGPGATALICAGVMNHNIGFLGNYLRQEMSASI